MKRHDKTHDSGRTSWIHGLTMVGRVVARAAATAVVVIGCRGLLAQTEFPDLGSTAADISVPQAEDAPAAAGRRTFVRLETQEPEIGYVVFLPANWEPSRKWPVFVELPGNGGYEDANGDRCSGLPEDCAMGYGLTEGRDWIWVCLPFLNDDGSAIARQWWGDAPTHDPAATLRFWRAALADVHRRFAGNPEAVVLAGFSRGAIACNALGLHDDDTAALWAAFLPCSHYDGVRPWPFPGSDRDAAERRLRRLGPRPQFICGEGEQTEATRGYLASTSIAQEQLTIVSTGFRNHSDRWTLRPCAARSKAREWLRARLPKVAAAYPDSAGQLVWDTFRGRFRMLFTLDPPATEWVAASREQPAGAAGRERPARLLDAADGRPQYADRGHAGPDAQHSPRRLDVRRGQWRRGPRRLLVRGPGRLQRGRRCGEEFQGSSGERLGLQSDVALVVCPRQQDRRAGDLRVTNAGALRQIAGAESQSCARLGRGHETGDHDHLWQPIREAMLKTDADGGLNINVTGRSECHAIVLTKKS